MLLANEIFQPLQIGRRQLRNHVSLGVVDDQGVIEGLDQIVGHLLRHKGRAHVGG